MVSLYARNDLGKILEDFNPQCVEEQKKILAVSQQHFTSLLDKYGRLSHEYWQAGFVIHSYCSKEITEVLSPHEINAFLQLTVDYDSRTHHHLGGFFITQLLRNAQAAGYSAFSLDTTAVGPLDHLGMDLKSIELLVTGPVGIHFCNGAAKSKITLIGTAEDFPFHNIKKSIVTIHGELNGQGGLECHGTTFRTSHKATLLNLLQHYEPRNRIQYITPEGKQMAINPVISSFLTLVDAVVWMRGE